MNAARLWALSKTRQRWLATLLLAVFAGLSGGAVLTLIGTARRTSTAVDRYLRQPDLATRYVIACPNGFTEKDIETAGIAPCFSTTNVADVAKRLRASRLVSNVVPIANVNVGLRAARSTGSKSWVATVQSGPIEVGDEVRGAVVVEGRLPKASEPNEIAINEQSATRLRVGVGDEVELAPYLASQQAELASSSLPEPKGRPITALVVAVIRGADDLRSNPNPTVLTTPAWWQRFDGEDLAYLDIGVGSLVALKDPNSSHTFDASVSALLPGRIFQSQDAFADPSSARRTVELQTAATWFVALVAAVAGIGFFAQTLRRQASVELSDRSTLNALGMKGRDVILAFVLRVLPLSLVAAALAVVVAFVASTFGPIGLARRIEISPGLRFDPAVLVPGFGLIVILTTVLAGLVVVRLVKRTDSTADRNTGASTAWPVPVAVRAGLSLVRRNDQIGLLGAVVGTMVATMLGIVALGTATGHRDMLAAPDRFGQGWTFRVGTFITPDDVVAAESRMVRLGGVAEYGRTRWGPATVRGRDLFVFSFPRTTERIKPVILEGRGPNANEVALGTRTLRTLKLALGDRVSITPPGGGKAIGPLTIVGTVVVNDGVTPQRLDDGALLTDATLDRIVPASVSQSLLVRGRTGVDPKRLRTELAKSFGSAVFAADRPEDIANLDRVAGAPFVIATLVGLLATSAMVNALVILVVRRRRDMAVFRALGFTRRQSVGSVAIAGLLLAGVGAVIGSALGLLASRYAWSLVTSRLGIRSPWVISIVDIGIPVLLAVSGTAVIALAAGLRATHKRQQHVVTPE